MLFAFDNLGLEGKVLLHLIYPVQACAPLTFRREPLWTLLQGSMTP